MSRGAKIILGCVAFTVIVCVCLAVAFGAFFYIYSGELKGVEIAIDAPHIVQSGKEFMITVNITNTGDKPIIIDAVNISGSVFEGMVVIGTSPTSRGVDIYEGIVPRRAYRYAFNETEIVPGETFIVEFNMQALQPGDYSGMIGVWTDFRFEDMRVHSRITSLRIVVQE